MLMMMWFNILFPEVASEHAEGGMYIGPEFQLGQVYDGSVENGDSVVLYRPVYLTVSPQQGKRESLRETHKRPVLWAKTEPETFIVRKYFTVFPISDLI